MRMPAPEPRHDPPSHGVARPRARGLRGGRPGRPGRGDCARRGQATAAVEGVGCRQRRVPARLVPPAEGHRLPAAGGDRPRLRGCGIGAVRDRPGGDGRPGDLRAHPGLHGIRRGGADLEPGTAEADARSPRDPGEGQRRFDGGAGAPGAVGGEHGAGARGEPGDGLSRRPRPRPPPDGARGSGRQACRRARDHRRADAGDGCGAPRGAGPQP